MLWITPVIPLPHQASRWCRRLAFGALLLPAVSGCTTPWLESSVAVPATFTAGPTTTAEVEVAWWQSYGDPVLASLISQAAHANRDVRMAAERLRAARAGETISRSAMLPSIGVSAGASNLNNGYSDAARLAAPEMQNRQGGLNISWELDLTGRLRAGAAAAAADVQASADQVRAVRLLVVADVASNYFILSGARRQLDTVTAIAAAQQETLRLVTARQRAGLASPFDVARAESDAAQAQAAIPPLQTLIARSRHRLAVLIGSQPAAAAALQPQPTAIAMPEVTPGMPAELLARRPDLCILQAQLDGANWRRQQAHTEWFPRLFTSALFGSQNLEVNGVDLGSARFGNVAAMMTMPLFDWGRTRSINDIAESAQTEAVLRYEDGIVRALEEVENGLIALRDEQAREQSLRHAASSAKVALDHATSLYQRGQIDLLPLLDAQRARLAVQVSANDSQTQLLLDSVQLFKALGGGWQPFESTPTSATAKSQHLTSANEVSS